MKVLYVALSTARIPQVAADATYVAEQGGQAVILTTKSDPWPALPDTVRLVDLAEAESAHWFVRTERLAVFRLPSLFLRVLRRLLLLLVRVAPGQARAAVDWVERLQDRHLGAATRWHKGTFAQFYRNLRPFVLWRVARRSALPALDIETFDDVVVADSLSTSLGWQIADANPQLPVGFDLVRDRS